MHYYYQIKPEYYETIHTNHPNYTFMLNPDFVIMRTNPLDLSLNGRFKFLDCVLRKEYVYEITEAAGSRLVATYTGPNNGDSIYVYPTLASSYSINDNNEVIYYIDGLFPFNLSRAAYHFSPSTEAPLEPATISEVEEPESLIVEKKVTKAFTSDHLKEEVTHRYAEFSSTSQLHSSRLNIADSYLPSILTYSNFCSYSMIDRSNNLFRNNHYPAVCMSEFTAAVLKVPKMPFEDMVGLLGYTKSHLYALYEKVRGTRTKLVVVGTGGTGINTLYWLREIKYLIGTSSSLFREIVLCDDDDLEFSNLLRFPIDPSTVQADGNGPQKKVRLAYPLAAPLCAMSPYTLRERLFTPDSQGNPIHHHAVFRKSSRTGGFSLRAEDSHRVVTYGAPDLLTRAQLSSFGNFICSTHADDSCSIWLNPSQDLDIQVESYGKIKLSTFFLNQLKMAIALLEILADDTIDLSEQNKHLLEYSVTPDLPEATGAVRNKYSLPV